MSKLEVDAIEPQSGTTLTIGASGDSVGIGTASPAATLDVSGGLNCGFLQSYSSIYATSGIFRSSDGSAASPSMQPGVDNDTGFFRAASNVIGFSTAGTERMRINASGEFMVGMTSASISNIGFYATATGNIGITRSGAASLILNRQTNDGDLVEFRKDGTVIGKLGSEGGDSLFILNGDTGLRFSGGADAIIPCTTAGATRDNAIDLGSSGARFDDIWATNGTIQTSDQNEKQSIQSLTTVEMNVAKRLSSLIKTFKWNSAVEEKGDSARTHTGIIAQDVQQAFADEGLDASNYALFLSNTWWEKEISVDAVQAVQAQEATYDEEGNELTPAIEAVEAKDAYTYIDTKEEATEGYTEKTRLGVRYPELLSFIQAYNDQRFTALEARITTLENK